MSKRKVLTAEIDEVASQTLIAPVPIPCGGAPASSTNNLHRGEESVPSHSMKGTRIVTTTRTKGKKAPPQSESARQREACLQSMPPDLRSVFDEIEVIFGSVSKATRDDRYRLGQLVHEVKSESNGDKYYGRAAIKTIAKALGRDRAGELYECLRLVEAFTKDEFEALAVVVLEDGRPLCWSHIRLLCSVVDRRERQRLLERTVAESLTADELAHAVRTALGRPETNRGATPKRPKTLDDAVKHQSRCADDLLNRATKSWHDDHSVTAFAQTLAPNEITHERAQSLRALAETMRRLAKEAEARAQEAEEEYRRFEAALELRAHEDDATRTNPKESSDETDDEEASLEATCTEEVMA